tara:strand:- start:3886 stop:4215 length:330 start_codon:yes stop_codon:yes gene_type:complete
MKWIIVAAFALASCNNSGPGADGYRFGEAEYRRPTVQLSIVEHRSLSELQGAASAAGADVSEGRSLRAFGVISGDRASCTIHVVAPDVDYQPEWLGHEVAHCLYGRWHS